MRPGEAPPTHTRRGLIHMSRPGPGPRPIPYADGRSIRSGGVRASHTGPTRPHFTPDVRPNPHKTPTGTHVRRETSALAMIVIHDPSALGVWITPGTPRRAASGPRAQATRNRRAGAAPREAASGPRAQAYPIRRAEAAHPRRPQQTDPGSDQGQPAPTARTPPPPKVTADPDGGKQPTRPQPAAPPQPPARPATPP
jgi:hypothetical protein